MSDEVAQAGWDILAEYSPIFQGANADPKVREAFETMKGGAALMQASSQKLIDDWNTNKAEQGMKHADRYNDDRRALIESAHESHRAGMRMAKEGYEAIRTALRSEVLPKVDEKRELLDRQMLDLALGDGDGASAGAKALRLAQTGDDAMKATLVSPYGRAKLKAAGVHDQTISSVEDTVIATSKHPSAKVAAGIGRLENVMIALDTAHRIRSKRR